MGKGEGVVGGVFKPMKMDCIKIWESEEKFRHIGVKIEEMMKFFVTYC